MRLGAFVLAAIVGVVAVTVGVGARSRPDGNTADERPARPTRTARPTPELTPGPLGVHSEGELAAAAEDVVGFLRGEVDFDQLNLAETVQLVLGREEGGSQREVARASLADPSAWEVSSDSFDHTYNFVPPENNVELATSVGFHENCLEAPLSRSFPELAQLPHVGTSLFPDAHGSCLQAWSLTVVFDPEAQPPTLVAAIYDQWEW